MAGFPSCGELVDSLLQSSKKIPYARIGGLGVNCVDRLRGLITTNYDRLLETTVTQSRHWTPNTFTPESISSLATALHNPDFFIFKLSR